MMSKYIELIDKYRIGQSDGTDYDPPSYKWVDNTGEIVRCKDCKNWEDKFPYSTCKIWHGHWEEDMYCSYGDRKDG